MSLTFVDRFYLLAVFNPRDQAHQRALAAAKSLKGRLITHDWVLIDVADALSGPANRARCVAYLDQKLAAYNDRSRISGTLRRRLGAISCQARQGLVAY